MLREQSRRVDAIRIGSHFRKDIELLRCDFRFTASHCEAQRLCSPFPEMQSSRIVPLASAPAGCAVPYSTTRDHCGTLKRFSRNISKAGAESRRRQSARASPLGDCAFPSFPHRLRVWFVGKCDHLRRPRCALGRSDPTLPLGKPDAPLRVRRSSRIRAHRRDLARPQCQLVRKTTILAALAS